MQPDMEPAINEWSAKILDGVNALLPMQPTEADLRRVVDPLLEEFCRTTGATPQVRAEYTLATGRADAIFNRLVIEYERPGTLKPSPDTQTKHAIQQVRHYIEGLARKERHSVDRLAGVVFDGCYLIFARYIGGRWVEESPAPANADTIARLLRWLQGLASGIALTPENLNNDFSLTNLRTQKILHALFQAFQTALQQPDGLVGKLFEQWRLFFSQSIDYSEAFGGRKLEALQKWVRKSGLEVRSAHEAEQFFFVLHTYFALLAKLLAWQAASKHIAQAGIPSFAMLATLSGEQLRLHLDMMERGGIFRALGIHNLLEGDFFAWYLQAWNPQIEHALKQIIQRLQEYDPNTLRLVPEETRDLFKKLYHYLLPREVRHNLGEYYTPDWLAHYLLNRVDPVLFGTDTTQSETEQRQHLLNTRYLDPACGSGTFLVLLIARMRALGQTLFVPETELLERILNNVVGFDINPLAVLTARVNYLLAIADLLPYRQGSITLPIYLADSVRTPAAGTELFTHDAYEFPTAVGKFLVPEVLTTPQRFDRFCDLLEESLRGEHTPSNFLARVEDELDLAHAPAWNDHARERTQTLYNQLLTLHRQGLNGLWARLLKNNFAPLAVGTFDYIVGNPPWINWEHLPDGYRESTKHLWTRYRLAGTFTGGRPRLGAVKVDISTLMSYVVMDTLLKEGGRLGFVITQSVLKTQAGSGYRRFEIPTESGDPVPLRVLSVDDMVDFNPFEGASNRTALIVLEKGQPTEYPVPYTVWRKKRKVRFTYDSTLREVLKATERLHHHAEPVNPNAPTSQWLTAAPKALRAVRKVLGKSDYEAHAGCCTWANAVYWVEIVYRRPDGLAVVRNLTEGAKVKVPEVTEAIEPDLLHPLLRGRDVQRWRAEPSAW
ncbi:MAG: Eco57I restriction-modification methylase domain-containing protein, partial [Fimbriimonadales bacterium]